MQYPSDTRLAAGHTDNMCLLHVTVIYMRCILCCALAEQRNALIMLRVTLRLLEVCAQHRKSQQGLRSP